MSQENTNTTIFQKFTEGGLRVSRNVGVMYNNPQSGEAFDNPIKYDSIKIKDMSNPSSKPLKITDELLAMLQEAKEINVEE